MSIQWLIDCVDSVDCIFKITEFAEEKTQKSIAEEPDRTPGGGGQIRT